MLQLVKETSQLWTIFQLCNAFKNAKGTDRWSECKQTTTDWLVSDRATRRERKQMHC